MKKRFSKRSFTMIELIVSLGVFSILSLSLMQFFTSVQGAWTTSERRAQLYADSRVVFDLIANAVKAAPKDQIEIETNPVKIKCPTTAADGTTGDFILAYDSEKHLLNLTTPDGANESFLLDGVMGFSATRYNKNFSDQNAAAGDSKYIVVTLKLLSYPDLKEYDAVPDDSKSEYLTNHAYEFVRMIILP